MARAEVRTHHRAPARERRATRTSSVDVCYIAFGEFCSCRRRDSPARSPSRPAPFSAPGDSGSLIVTQGGNQPVALAVRGRRRPDDRVRRSTSVLQRFGVTIEGTPPGDGPPGAPTGLRRDRRRRRPRRAHLERPELRRRLAGHAATASTAERAPGAETFPGGRARRRRYADASADERHDLLLQGVRRQRQRRGRRSRTRPRRHLRRRSSRRSLPFAIVDDFNRANENPLSDAGRWTNAIIGRRERPQRHLQPARLRGRDDLHRAGATTTQYGPDVEVWARMATLPGDGQRQLRLYARLQMPGIARRVPAARESD